MVDGRPTVIKRAVIVDLDGTLITGNSFRLYLLRAGQGALYRGRILTASQLCVLVALRKLRLISHNTLKQKVLKATKNIADKRFITALTDELMAMLRPEVADKVAECRRHGMMTVLATAAPGIYARPMGLACGMDNTLCTEDTELEGRAKAEAVARLMRDTDASPCIIITDRLHDGTIPDHPLLSRYPQAEHIIIGPTEKK
ncbi:MAG: haloacid dehalogenase-like hydrolase [Muribaculaceae bacterium]|nr:haloacid dehalogenase-like hydrolase [Muribaculaceae bacterium]